MQMSDPKTQCVACQHEIDASAKLCPFCGANPVTGEKFPRRYRWKWKAASHCAFPSPKPTPRNTWRFPGCSPERPSSAFRRLREPPRPWRCARRVSWGFPTSDPRPLEAASPPREDHCAAGRRGESHALDYLRAKGYRLVARNFRSGRGEIDLIVDAPDGSLVFVEVKSNRSSASGRPLERVDGRKVRRLQRLAQRYCIAHGQEDRDMRFDVVGVDLPPGGGCRVEHIEAAFLPDGSAYWGS